jgi:hypothetical protein
VAGVFKRANVVWKQEGSRVLIMAKGSIFSLNERGAQIWLALDGRVPPPSDEESRDFIEELKALGLVEEAGT